jgi:hypothetical protein
MSYLSRKKKRRGEDVVGLAGWLFTDLLLGISLIFLATTSFQVVGANGEDGCESNKYEKTYFPTPLLARYTDRQLAAKTIRAQMDEFSLENKLKDYEVAVALVYGFYEPGPQTAGDGQRFAFSFYKDSLVLADPGNFPTTKGPSLDETQDTNVRFYGAPPDIGNKRVPRNGVYVELFFIYNQCQA